MNRHSFFKNSDDPEEMYEKKATKTFFPQASISFSIRS